MPNSRQTSVIASPSKSRPTNRRRSSITEHSSHGINTSRPKKAKGVTHVSGTICHLCLRPLIVEQQQIPSLPCKRNSQQALQRFQRGSKNAPQGPASLA